MSVQTVYDDLKTKLHDVVPDVELRLKAELAEEILRLKAERDVVILGHNYMEPALFHSVPDFTGDSLGLCRQAARTRCRRIVFCGVRFMAETAKILNPEKIVLLPAVKAGCSLAESVSAEDVRRLKARYPGVPVVVYVNTYADVKAEADYCCTSGNAEQVLNSIDSAQVIFLPDEYLAANVARATGRKLIPAEPNGRAADHECPPEGTIIGWSGRCEVHDRFRTEDIENARRQFPGVQVLAHPECRPDVVQAADFAGSTAAMIRRVRESSARRYLLLTECAMGDNIAADNPDKEMLRICSFRCPHMNEISLEETLAAIREDRHQIEVPEPTLSRARRSIDRMLAIA